MKTANIFITDSDYSCDDKSFRYLLGFQPTLWTMLLTEKKLFVLLDSRYFWKTKFVNKQNIDYILWKNVEIIFIETKKWIEDLVKIILQENIEKLIFEWKIASEYVKEITKQTKLNYEILKWWFFTKKRMYKTKQELEKIKKAIWIIDKVYSYIYKLNLDWKLKWKTELEIRWIILSKIFGFGGEWESFTSIVAFWKNSAIPHHTTWNTVIEDGVLLIDMWALFDGYCSDFTRTFWVWEKNKQYEKFVKIYDIVKKAHLNAFENAKNWFTGEQIDSLTRKVIQKAWYENYFTHWTGHGLGLDIHEAPWIKQGQNNKIENNMVFTIEPWIYLEWEFWIRLEDIVVMENWKLKKYTNIEL